MIGVDLLPRSQISKRVMDYAKGQHLQDPNDRRRFFCDDKLHKVLGTPEFTMFSVNKLVVPMLKKPEDVGEAYVTRAREMEDQLLAEMMAEDPAKRSKYGFSIGPAAKS